MTSCNSINPFFGDWDTPYSLPPFGEIHETDYLRAVKFGIHQQASEVDAIIARDAEPTFENTIAAYEHSGRLLDRVTLVLFNLAESDATPALQKVVDRVIPLLTEHTDNIFMNPYFFERVKTVYDNRNSSGAFRLNLSSDFIHECIVASENCHSNQGLFLYRAGRKEKQCHNKKKPSHFTHTIQKEKAGPTPSLP